MRIDTKVYLSLVHAVREATGLDIYTFPVQKLVVTGTDTVKKNRDKILGLVPEEDRQEAGRLLDLLVATADRLRRELQEGDTGPRSTILSYLLSVLNGWGFHEAVFDDVVANLPDVYVTGQDAVFAPSPEEARRLGLRDMAEELAKEYLKHLVSVDKDTGQITLTSIWFKTGVESIIRLLYTLDRRNEAVRITRDYIERLLPEGQVTGITENKITISLPPSDDVSAEIHAELDIPGLKIANPELVIKSREGVYTVRLIGTVFKDTPSLIYNAKFVLERFVNNVIRLATIIREELGWPTKRLAERGRYGLSAEKKTSNMTATIKVYTTLFKEKVELTVTGKPSPEHRDSLELYTKLVTGMYYTFNPEARWDGGNLTVHFSTDAHEKEDIVLLAKIITKDFEVLASSKKPVKLNSEQLIAAYTVLALTGKNPIDVLSCIAGPPTIIMYTIDDTLWSRRSGALSLSDYKRPENLVRSLVASGEIDFTDNLEPLLFGKKLADLIKPVRDLLWRDLDTDVLVRSLAKRLLEIYREVHGESYVRSLYGDKELKLSTLIRHIELGVPVEPGLLFANLDGKPVWTQLPVHVKEKALAMLTVDDLMKIAYDPTLPLSAADRVLVLKTLCDGRSPSYCTKYVAEKYPHIIGLKNQKLVEKDNQYYIQAGAYSVQVEKIEPNGLKTFIVEGKDVKKRVKGRDIREALRKTISGTTLYSTIPQA